MHHRKPDDKRNNDKNTVDTVRGDNKMGPLRFHVGIPLGGGGDGGDKIGPRHPLFVIWSQTVEIACKVQ
jgi:hypothetical protein